MFLIKYLNFFLFTVCSVEETSWNSKKEANLFAHMRLAQKLWQKKTIDHFNHYEAEAARRRAERCSVENSSRGVGVGDCSCINTSYSQF
jgi:hypothetical protein